MHVNSCLDAQAVPYDEPLFIAQPACDPVSEMTDAVMMAPV
jgi:hypothetical protein